MNMWGKIERLAYEKRMNSKALAEVAGVCPSTVTGWKNGARINSVSLKRIADHFAVAVDELLSDDAPIKSVRETPAPYTTGEATGYVLKEVAGLRDHCARLEKKLDYLTAQMDTISGLLGKPVRAAFEPGKKVG